jgi:Apea-like HEPN
MTQSLNKNNQLNPKTKHFWDFAPKKWFKDCSKGSLWVTGYRALRVRGQFPKPHVIHLKNLTLVIVQGTIQYLDTGAAKIEIIDEANWKFDGEKIVERTSVAGTYVLIMAPFDVDGTIGNEAAVRNQITEAVGLLTSLHGRNIVFQHLFDNIIEMTEHKSSAFSPVMDNLHFFPIVGVGSNATKLLRQADAAIAKSDQKQRTSMSLALRWFKSAVFETDGISGFVKYWVAIETLAMPDTTNIAPINQMLSDAYGMSIEGVRHRFLVGRLLNLRSEIIHNGHLGAINANLFRYMESLFSDLLSIKLGLRFEKRADAILREPNFDLQALISTP